MFDCVRRHGMPMCAPATGDNCVASRRGLRWRATVWQHAPARECLCGDARRIHRARHARGCAPRCARRHRDAAVECGGWMCRAHNVQISSAMHHVPVDNDQPGASTRNHPRCPDLSARCSRGGLCLPTSRRPPVGCRRTQMHIVFGTRCAATTQPLHCHSPRHNTCPRVPICVRARSKRGKGAAPASALAWHEALPQCRHSCVDLHRAKSCWRSDCSSARTLRGRNLGPNGRLRAAYPSSLLN